MNRSVSSNYLSPCFVLTQIFVATIAFLLPGAEHSTLEADKKVCVGKKVLWNGWDLKTPWSIMLEWFSCRGMFLLSAVVCVLSLFSSPVLTVIICKCPTLQLHQHCTLFFWFYLLVFVEHTGKCNYAFCVISSVNGVAAALSAGLVHGRPPEFAAGTHHYVFLGGSHIP